MIVSVLLDADTARTVAASFREAGYRIRIVKRTVRAMGFTAIGWVVVKTRAACQGVAPP